MTDLEKFKKFFEEVETVGLTFSTTTIEGATQMNFEWGAFSFDNKGKFVEVEDVNGETYGGES